jgi:predicted metal-dependent hydrolase
MPKTQRTQTLQDIEFNVIYSGRRTLGISVLPDSSVIVRVPYRTSDKTINRIIEEKASWIIKHRDYYRNKDNHSLNRQYVDGEIHLFRGKEYALKVEKSIKQYIRFSNGAIELGLGKPQDAKAVMKLLYKGYKDEASEVFPILLNTVLQKLDDLSFKPAGLIIRTMKRRWGSCSNKGVITLSTELIKLPDIYIEYVIIHELCHLRHHNHGTRFYKLLTELFPEWKTVRKELRKYIR